jgi:phosphatidylethanolamine-binding protein (PEBP) family uncharacterized protein
VFKGSVMKKRWLIIPILALCTMFSACQLGLDSGKCDFCNQTMNYKIFENDMKVSFTHVNPDNTLDKKYGCPPTGASLFPSIEFSGLPKEATHLHIQFIDATCSYGCNDCCQFNHCTLEFPLTALKDKSIFNFNGIKEMSNPNVVLKKYLLKNGAGKREYFPFCPPPFQTHAYYIRMSAFKLDQDGKKTIIAKTQSVPVLFWSQKDVRAYETEKKLSPKNKTSKNPKDASNQPITAPINPNKPAESGAHIIEPLKKDEPTKPKQGSKDTSVKSSELKDASPSESKQKPTEQKKKKQLTFEENSWE